MTFCKLSSHSFTPPDDDDDDDDDRNIIIININIIW